MDYFSEKALRSYLSGEAMDGMDVSDEAVSSVTPDIVLHDRKYHRGCWSGKGRCKYREDRERALAAAKSDAERQEIIDRLTPEDVEGEEIDRADAEVSPDAKPIKPYKPKARKGGRSMTASAMRARERYRKMTPEELAAEREEGRLRAGLRKARKEGNAEKVKQLLGEIAEVCAKKRKRPVGTGESEATKKKKHRLAQLPKAERELRTQIADLDNKIRNNQMYPHRVSEFESQRAPLQDRLNELVAARGGRTKDMPSRFTALLSKKVRESYGKISEIKAKIKKIMATDGFMMVDPQLVKSLQAENDKKKEQEKKDAEKLNADEARGVIARRVYWANWNGGPMRKVTVEWRKGRWTTVDSEFTPKEKEEMDKKAKEANERARAKKAKAKDVSSGEGDISPEAAERLEHRKNAQKYGIPLGTYTVNLDNYREQTGATTIDPVAYREWLIDGGIIPPGSDAEDAKVSYLNAVAMDAADKREEQLEILRRIDDDLVRQFKEDGIDLTDDDTIADLVDEGYFDGEIQYLEDDESDKDELDRFVDEELRKLPNLKEMTDQELDEWTDRTIDRWLASKD